ncbi:MAG: hypothetical protein ACREUN_02165 [Burkholderiales bacterium]
MLLRIDGGDTQQVVEFRITGALLLERRQQVERGASLIGLD